MSSSRCDVDMCGHQPITPVNYSKMLSATPYHLRHLHRTGERVIHVTGLYPVRQKLMIAQCACQTNTHHEFTRETLFLVKYTTVVPLYQSPSPCRLQVSVDEGYPNDPRSRHRTLRTPAKAQCSAAELTSRQVARRSSARAPCS